MSSFDPFREMQAMQDRMNQLFRESGRGSASPQHQELMTTGTFVPPTDVYEDQHGIVVLLDVPGVDQGSIDVHVEQDALTVRGERKLPENVHQDSFLKVERPYGQFGRIFALPHSVDPEKVSADCENGVLKITLAKREESKPKQIKVNVGAKKRG